MPKTTETAVPADTDGGEIMARKAEYDAREDVGPRLPGGAVHGRTSDWEDGKRSWTVQSAKPMPSDDLGPTTFFHPSELPDPDVAIAAGMMPLVNPGHLVKADHITMPPSGNYPVDHPVRDVHRREITGPAQGMQEAYDSAKALTEVTLEDADVEEAPSAAQHVGDVQLN
jgi:hypothetical protein